MIGPSRREVRAAYLQDKKELAERYGITEEAVEDLLHALPYSSIPTLQDLVDLVDALEEHGWRRIEGDTHE